jgi:hypothetical protein
LGKIDERNSKPRFDTCPPAGFFFGLAVTQRSPLVSQPPERLGGEAAGVCLIHQRRSYVLGAGGRKTKTQLRARAEDHYFCCTQLDVTAKLLAADRIVIWLTVCAAFSQLA